MTGAPEPMGDRMARLDVQLAGVHAPNPFWLAAGRSVDDIVRAFDAGWGGAVLEVDDDLRGIERITSRYTDRALIVAVSPDQPMAALRAF